MEVKRLKLDLVEGTKKWADCWKLESEAFKDPLVLEIGYDDKDKEFIKEMCKKADGIVDDAFHALNEAKNAEQINAELVKSYKKELELSKQRIESLEKQLEQKTMKETQLNTVIQDYKNYEKIVNGTILALREKVDEIWKKTTKQPKIFNYVDFRAWDWISYTKIDIEHWEYIKIKQETVVEHNEYVDPNQFGTSYEKVVIWESYFEPWYLQWNTPLDKPTATVEVVLTFIPC